jgi:hypothetical protein
VLDSLEVFELGHEGSIDPEAPAPSFKPDAEAVKNGPIKLIWVETDTLPAADPMNAMGGRVTNEPGPMLFSSRDGSAVLAIDWIEIRTPRCVRATSAGLRLVASTFHRAAARP